MTESARRAPVSRVLPVRSAALLVAAVLATGLAGCDRGELPAPDPGPFDLVIRGAQVLDGTGAEAFEADIGVSGDRITRVAREGIAAGAGEREIEAEGLVVAPGFIDLHAHLDPLLRLPHAESHVRQGVTTGLGGPDGSAPLPLGSYLDSAQVLGVGMNVAFLAGHNTIRREVMGLDDRAPTSSELEAMKALVGGAMDDGAFGLSTGLRYIPGAFSDIDEVVALSEVAAAAGGIYTSHLRDEGRSLMDGVGEALEIGRRAEIPVVLTHHKVVGFPMWGSSEQTLAMVDSARAAGTDAMIDQYPYTATYTGITILIPEWAMGGGTDGFLARMDDPVLADSILAGIRDNLVNDRGGNDLDRVQLARVSWDTSLEGGSLGDWADREGLPRTMETGAELVVEAVRRGGVSAIYHALDEADVERIMQHPMTAIASDGRLVEPGDGHPHPRWYGTFPRVLGAYVRERGVLTLPEAIRKMTTLPADRLGLADRGRIAEGAYADLVVFDPATVIDRATFTEPHQYPEGIPWVIVNGQVTVDNGAFQDVRAGRVLRRTGAAPPR
jgi:N-acyl-D-amino-acid deacylase